MLMYPDPLLMNAMNLVNISGAVLLTSAEYAAELGIPRSKWIYALGGAGTRDSPNCKIQPTEASWYQSLCLLFQFGSAQTFTPVLPSRDHWMPQLKSRD